MDLSTKDKILSAMVMYRFWDYENGLVSIPNKELMEKFNNALVEESSLGYVHRLSNQSKGMHRFYLLSDGQYA